MKFEKLRLEELILFKPERFFDERGYFQESYSKKKFDEIVGEDVTFVQDNFSLSKKGVFRGIHLQKKPFQQGKLVKVTFGTVIDFAIDLRPDSKNYLQWEKVLLSEENGHQLWIPEGFGHAFFTISELAHFNYKTTNFYNKESEDCIIWNDPKIGISLDEYDIDMKISKKDLEGGKL